MVHLGDESVMKEDKSQPSAELACDWRGEKKVGDRKGLATKAMRDLRYQD